MRWRGPGEGEGQKLEGGKGERGKKVEREGGRTRRGRRPGGGGVTMVQSRHRQHT